MTNYLYKGERIVAPLTISSDEIIKESESLNLKTTRVRYPSQRWLLSFNVEPTSSNLNLDSLVDEIENNGSTQTMVMPQLSAALELFSVQGSHYVSGNFVSGTDSLDLNTSGGYGILPSGYFVKFSNHDKVYMVTAQRNFNANSRVLKIFPKLAKDVPSGTQVLFGDDVTLVYKRELSDMVGITFTDGVLTSKGTVNIKENL